MSARTTSRARRIVSRISAVWADMDHAQRRMVEIQTGLNGLTREHGRRTPVRNSQLDTQL
jgi:hypothetical protein